MSFVSLLKDTCQILRFTLTGTDSMGQEKGTWVIVENVKCRVERESPGNLSITVGGAAMSVVEGTIFFINEPQTVILNEHQFRLRWRELAGGQTLDFKIRRIEKRDAYATAHHLEVMCEAVNTRSEY